MNKLEKMIDLKNKLVNQNIVLKDAIGKLNKAKFKLTLENNDETLKQLRNTVDTLKDVCFDLEFEILERSYYKEKDLINVIMGLDKALNFIALNNEFLIESMMIVDKLYELNREDLLGDNVFNLKHVFNLYLLNLSSLVNSLKDNEELEDKNIYNIVFSSAFSKVVFMICEIENINKDYYDPDTSYSEDVLYFMSKVKDIADELKN